MSSADICEQLETPFFHHAGSESEFSLKHMRLWVFIVMYAYKYTIALGTNRHFFVVALDGCGLGHQDSGTSVV